METAAPVSYHHTIDIALDPPLASAGEASLWVEISAGDPGGLSHEASTGGRSDATSPTLVLSRVDGDGAEQRFALPQGTYRRFVWSYPRVPPHRDDARV